MYATIRWILCLTVLGDGGRNRSLESRAAKSTANWLYDTDLIKALWGVMDRCREPCIVSMFWATWVSMPIRWCQKAIGCSKAYNNWLEVGSSEWHPEQPDSCQKFAPWNEELCLRAFVLGFTTERKYLYHECLPDTRHLKLFLYKSAKFKALCKRPPLVCSRCIVTLECKW